MESIHDDILTCSCGKQYPAVWDYKGYQLICLNERRCQICQAALRIAESDLKNKRRSSRKPFKG